MLRAKPSRDLSRAFQGSTRRRWSPHAARQGYAVCDKTYNLYNKAPYREFFEFVDPLVDVPLDEAKPFDCSRTALRHPKETKGQDYDATTEANNTCCDGGSCC